MSMNLNKIAVILILATAMACHDHDNTKKPSWEELLTGKSSKSWNVAFSSFDEEESDVSCRMVNAYTADNALIFKTKGEFEYSNGTIHEIADCEECTCGDLADLVGTWSLSKEDTLSVFANGRIEDNGDITFFDGLIILKYKISSITENEIIIGNKTTFIRYESK
jgi:hypothetical protein